MRGMISPTPLRSGIPCTHYMTRAERVEKLRKQYIPGMRLQLHDMEDAQAPAIGTCGTVVGVDDVGQIMVEWDTGSSLSLIPGIDDFEVVSEKITALKASISDTIHDVLKKHNADCSRRNARIELMCFQNLKTHPTLVESLVTKGDIEKFVMQTIVDLL